MYAGVDWLVALECGLASEGCTTASTWHLNHLSHPDVLPIYDGGDHCRTLTRLDYVSKIHPDEIRYVRLS